MTSALSPPSPSAPTAPRILIGTASWTDPGFIADWYPRSLPPGDRLRWYADHFDLVEVNSTFYAIPPERTVQQWHDQTPPDFVFDIKLHQLLSRHRAEAKFLPPDLRRELPLAGDVVKLTSQSEKLVLQRMLRELAPIVTSKKFGAFLLQLSPAFSPREHILAELDHLFALLSGYRVAVELRNRAWMNDEQALSTVEFFRERRATLVTVDAPETEHFTVMPRTHVVSNSSLAYYRLHGRDAQAFVRGRTVADRFNYQYSGEELEEIARHIITWSRDVQEFHAVFNNNRSDFAPAAARKLLQLLAAFRSTNVRVRPRRVPQQLSFDGEQGGLTAETSEL